MRAPSEWRDVRLEFCYRYPDTHVPFSEFRDGSISPLCGETSQILV